MEGAMEDFPGVVVELGPVKLFLPGKIAARCREMSPDVLEGQSKFRQAGRRLFFPKTGCMMTRGRGRPNAMPGGGDVERPHRRVRPPPEPNRAAQLPHPSADDHIFHKLSGKIFPETEIRGMP